MKGEQLVQLRTKLGLTQRAFAELIGMSPSAVAMVEAQHREMSVAMRIKIAENIPITDELIKFFDEQSKWDRVIHNNNLT